MQGVRIIGIYIVIQSLCMGSAVRGQADGEPCLPASSKQVDMTWEIEDPLWKKQIDGYNGKGFTSCLPCISLNAPGILAEKLPIEQRASYQKVQIQSLPRLIHGVVDECDNKLGIFRLKDAWREPGGKFPFDNAVVWLKLNTTKGSLEKFVNGNRVKVDFFAFSKGAEIEFIPVANSKSNPEDGFFGYAYFADTAMVLSRSENKKYMHIDGSDPDSAGP